MCLLWWAGFLPAQAVAQLEVATQRLFPGWEQGSWVPVQVEIENLAQRFRRLEVRLTTVASFKQREPVVWELELSPGARKLAVLPAYLPASRFLEGLVEIYEDGALVWNEQTFPLRTGARQSPVANCLVIVPGDQVPSDVIEEAFRRTHTKADLHRVSREFVPTSPEIYQSIQHVVLYQVAAADFSAAQRQAIVQAVRSGTQAWVVPGKAGEGNDWLEPRAGNFERTPRRSPLGQDFDAFLVPGNSDPGRRVDASSVHRSRDFPSVLYYPEGLGGWFRFTTTGVLPIVPRTKPRLGSKDFSLSRTHDDSWRRDTSSFAWLDSLDRVYRKEVRLELVFILIATYLFVIGPGLFFLLRRKGKLIWLLWLQPLVVVLFLLGVYLVGYLNFGIPSASYETLVVKQPEGSQWGYGTAIASEYNSIARPRDVESKSGLLPIALQQGKEGRSQSWRITADGTSYLQGFYFPTWSLLHFQTQGPLLLSGELTLRIVEIQDQPGLGTPFAFEVDNQLNMSVKSPAFRLPPQALAVLPPELRERLRRRFGADPCCFEGEIPARSQKLFPIDQGRAWRELRRETADPQRARWLQTLSSFWQTCDPPARYLVEFDPADLPGTGADFSLEGERTERRGVLLGVQELEGP